MVRNDFHCQTVKSSSKTEWTKMANNWWTLSHCQFKQIF
jgi:hypothetical protein